HRRAARVVAMKPEARVQVQLGAFPRSEHRSAFRAHDAGPLGPGVSGIAGLDVEAVAVSADSRQRSKPRRPRDFVLCVQRAACLKHLVFAHRLETPPRLRMEQADGDPVGSGLNAERVSHLSTGQLTCTRVTDLPAGYESM